MNEVPKEEIIQEYQERYRFWTDKRISQLSFHNNLMLTLGFAVIGYFWSERDSVYTKLVINFDAEIDWKVLLFLLGVSAIAVSIISGFILSLSRLYDLRLTSNITLSRKRISKNDIELKDEELSKSRFADSIKSLFSVIQKYQDYEITYSDIKENNNLQAKITEIRQKSHDLGRSTWGLLKCQTACMLIGIVLFMLVLAIK
jgi:hypothetical protein